MKMRGMIPVYECLSCWNLAHEHRPVYAKNCRACRRWAGREGWKKRKAMDERFVPVTQDVLDHIDALMSNGCCQKRICDRLFVSPAYLVWFRNGRNKRMDKNIRDALMDLSLKDKTLLPWYRQSVDYAEVRQHLTFLKSRKFAFAKIAKYLGVSPGMIYALQKRSRKTDIPQDIANKILAIHSDMIHLRIEPYSKFYDHEVCEMIRLVNSGHTIAKVSAKFGMSERTLDDIVKARAWAWADPSKVLQHRHTANDKVDCRECRRLSYVKYKKDRKNAK